MIIGNKQYFKRFIKVSLLLLCLSSCDKKHNEIKYLNIDTLLEQKNYNSLNRQSKEKYLDAIVASLKVIQNDSIVRNKYFKIADFYFDLNAIEKYKKTSDAVLELSIKKKDIAHMAQAQRFLGDYYDNVSKTDSAFYFYNQASKNFFILKDDINVARTKLYKAGILYDIGVYTESEIETIAALRLLEKSDKTRLKYECHNLLAINLIRLKNYDSALSYFKKANQYLDILGTENYDKEKLIKSRISCYNNIGVVYEALKDYKAAKDYYIKALAIEDVEQNNPKLYAMLINNLAYTDLLLGNSRDVRQNLYRALEIKKRLKLDAGVVSSKLTISKYFLYQKDTATAIQMLNETYREATAIKSTSDILESLRILINIDKSKAKFLSELYFNTNDSIQNLERQTRNKFARIEFETDQVVAENDFLTTQKLYIIFGLMLTLFLIGVFFNFYRIKVRNTELLYIDAQNNANQKVYDVLLNQQRQNEIARHEERNRIARELHDGIINNVFSTTVNIQSLDIEPLKKAQLVQELEKTGIEIRQMSHDLKKNLFFQDQKLTEILLEFIKNQKSSTTLFDITIDKFIDWDYFSNENKIHIYRIVQEAIHNVHKYASAKRCDVYLQRNGNCHILKIVDDGVGFDLTQIKAGIGLKNIMERTNFLEGTINIQSSSKTGTSIEVNF